MTYEYTNNGRNFVEQAIADASFDNVMNTVSVGEGSDTLIEESNSLDILIYEETDDEKEVTIERGNNTGEIVATITFTGGLNIPAGSDVIEFGLKDNAGNLLYREVRDTPISADYGKRRTVEIHAFVEDSANVNDKQVITDVGKNYIADRIIGDNTDSVDTIAVGNGTGEVDKGDTQMTSELYRASDSNSNTTLESTTSTGEIRAEITLSAGQDTDDELSGGTDITEFGLFTSSNVMLYHEKQKAVTLEADDTKTFNIPFSII